MTSCVKYGVSNADASRTSGLPKYDDVFLTSVIYLHGHYHERVEETPAAVELQTTKTGSATTDTNIDSEDHNVDTSCGCGSLRPKSMQRCASPRWYLLVLSLCAVIQGEVLKTGYWVLGTGYGAFIQY